MKAICAHLRYISKNGRLDIEDENGTHVRGAMPFANWPTTGALAAASSTTPATDARPSTSSCRCRAAAPSPWWCSTRGTRVRQAELAGHKYVMVLHDHQANPHVHISVRAEAKNGKRLNPRKADLQRWRETFAEKLRGWGIDADATRRSARGVTRHFPRLWQVKAQQKAASPGRHRHSDKAAPPRPSAATPWRRGPASGRRSPHRVTPATKGSRQAVGRFVHELRAGQAHRPAIEQDARDLRGRGR